MKISPSLLRQRCTIQRDNESGDYGEEAYEEVKNVRVRFVRREKSVMGPNGNLETVQATAQFLPEDVITAQDRVVYEGVAYTVFTLREGVDGNGTIVVRTVTLQQWRT